MDRHCVTQEGCRNMDQIYSRRKLNFPLGAEESKPWFTWNGTCIQTCPRNYERDDKHGCLECSGTCRKTCSGLSVDSIMAAQTLQHCTHITGNLEIQIHSDSPGLIDELENGLGLIEEIEGNLRVIRSFPLVNLFFFKNLKVIKGKSFNNEKNYNYSFRVHDNPNLQELFDWNRPAGRNFTIENNGRIFFHFNPKLCLKYVEELIQVANISDITELEVDKTFDEKMFACNVKNIPLHIRVKTANSFLVVIEKSDFVNISSLEQDWLRVMVYYKEAPYMNITSHYDDNVCQDDGWRFKDVKLYSAEHGDRIPVDGFYHLVTQLKPYTQYAFYVRTYSSGKEVVSTIHYVQTLPTKPSPPESLHAISNSSDEIILKWSPPFKTNGLLKNYIIQGILLEDDQNLPHFRNFCQYPAVITPEVTSPPPEFRSIIGNNKINEDDYGGKNKKNREPKLLCEQPGIDKYGKLSHHSFFHEVQIISCEKFMYNLINENVLKPKLLSKSKERRSTLTPNKKFFSSKLNLLIDDDDSNFTDNGKTYNSDGTLKSFLISVSNVTNKIFLKNLMHFGRYLIEIKACREKVPEEELSYFFDTRCSDTSFVTFRSKKSFLADQIEQKSINIKVTNKSAVVSWKTPSNFNGVILSYNVECKSMDKDNVRPKIHCISSLSNKSNSVSFNLTNLNFGNYAVRIRVVSLAGEGPFSKSVMLLIVDNSYSNWLEKLAVITSVTFISILAAVLGTKALVCYYQKKLKDTDILIETINPEYTSVNGYVEDDWELSRDDIVLVKEIKQGNFGMVHEGLLLPENRRVAVKTVKETSSIRDNCDFLNEANVMKAFSGAHHVVKLLGVVSKGSPPLVVMELMVLGDLKSFLRLSRDSSQYPPPSPSRLNLMAAQIADGMVYLEALKYVHRDLAARNCMVSEDLTVKIGDFGMTRDIYDTDYYRKGNKGLLPIRWMAPESLNDGVFTSCSDVWSYGVVLWEMVTLATQPYQGMSNEEVLQHVVSGNKLDTPVYCPPLLKVIMASCWKWKPKLRPTFCNIINLLEPNLNMEFRSNSYYHSIERQNMHSSEQDEFRDNEQTSLLLLPSSSSVEFYPSCNSKSSH